jgi:hypothetical protein
MGSGTSRHDAGSGPAANDKFVLLDTLVMANGLKGTISQRRSNGLITFSIVREFTRDGVVDWTTFIPEQDLPDYKLMLEMVQKRIGELRADPKVPKCQAAGPRK